MDCGVACESAVLRLAVGRRDRPSFSKDYSSVDQRPTHRNQSMADLWPLDRSLWPDPLETFEDSRPILFAQQQCLSYSAGPWDSGLATVCRSIQNFENLCFRLPSRTAICRSGSTPRGPSLAVPRRFFVVIDLWLDSVVDRRVHCRLRA